MLSMLLLLTCLVLRANPLPGEDAPTPANEAALNAARIAAASGNTNASAQAFPAFPGTTTRRPRGGPPPAALPGTAATAPAPPGDAASSIGATTAPPTVAGATPSATPTAPANKPEEEMIGAGLIKFTGADLNQVLETYAPMAGRSILRSPNVTCPPIFFSNITPLTKAEAIQAYDALLAINGIAIIKIGEKFMKAVPAAEAIAAGGPVNTNLAAQLPDMGHFVTHVVQLKYVKPSEMMQALQPFAKVPLAILAIDASQIIVLRDYTENVKRMLEMIERIDVNVPPEFISEVIPIKFAKAEDIATALNSLSSGGGGTTTSVGTPAATGGRRLSTGAGGLGGLGGARGGFGAQPGQPGYNPNAVNTPGAGVPSSGASFSDRINNIIKRAATPGGGAGDFQILGLNKIIADVRSNSLLVFAARADLTMIKDIISKLDVVLAQVLIETIIMDVSLDKQWSLGVSAGQRPKLLDGTNNVIGGVINNGSNPLGTGIGFLNQFTSGTNGSFTPNANFTYPSAGGLNYYGRLASFMNWDVMVNAAASDSRVNVIQKPRIQTSHATTGSIFIGSTVPYVTSSYGGGGIYGGVPSSQYQQLRVGLELNVTPFINQDGLVVMTIDEKIDELSGSTEIAGVGKVPNTSSRTFSAEVAVRDGETIILGGFIRNADTKNVSGVPILKDIPLLGALFTTRDSSKVRTELIVLMRPTVLRTPAGATQQLELEKQRLPGVLKAEADLKKFEDSIAPKPDKKDFKKVTPLTPEGERLYGKPNATTPSPSTSPSPTP